MALELAERGFGLSLGLLLLFSVVAVAYTFSPLLALWYQHQPRSGVPLTLSQLLVEGELPHQLLLAFGVTASMELLEAQPLQSTLDWELQQVPLLGISVLQLQLAVQPLLLGLLLLTLYSWQPAAVPVFGPPPPPPFDFQFPRLWGLGEGVITNEDSEVYSNPDNPAYPPLHPNVPYPVDLIGSDALEGPTIVLGRRVLEHHVNQLTNPLSTTRLLVQHLKLEKAHLAHLQRVISEQWPAEPHHLPAELLPTPIAELAPGVVVSPEECYAFSENFTIAVANYG